jgi:hypothetical protein
VNILIHITTGILLYLFIKTTLSLPSLLSGYKNHTWIPFIAVFLWLVHPIQTQSVTYIVQRMNGMAAMFYVLSLWLYARARLAEEKKKKRALFGGCILAGILSLGSKEMAATLPFFLFLYEWYFFRDLSWAWLKRHFMPIVGMLILLGENIRDLRRPRFYFNTKSADRVSGGGLLHYPFDLSSSFPA